MDQKLTPNNFTQIFKDSLANLTLQIPKKSFDYCIKDFNLPYLKEEEKKCIFEFTNKYLCTMDYALIWFSKKLI